jgi:cysteine desulfurase
MDVKKMGLGLATINAHKINGPKGVGALYVSRGTKLSAFIHGGQQERGLRGGTENVAGVVGFAKAAELVTASELKKMQLLRDKLISGITAGIKDSRLNGHPKERLVNNTNFTFKNVEGEALLLRLDMKGVYCSTGSACSSQSLEPSHIITAIGLPPEESHGSLRATLGYNSSDEDIDYAIETISDEVENLRKISPLTRR